MVKHIILWKLKDEFNNDEVKRGIKESLEELLGVIPGLIEIKVQIEKLESSKNADVMLYSVFESEKALKEYAVHPAHVKVADTKVRPFTQTRSCIDFIEK
ncbi:MAG: Dabb family protein [Clostridia bacterium]|nr:Dabb family protein [Clostridia bacterium]MBQ8758320.1 Dabb family protein [Clostridia bacterium]